MGTSCCIYRSHLAGDKRYTILVWVHQPTCVQLFTWYYLQLLAPVSILYVPGLISEETLSRMGRPFRARLRRG